MSQETAVSPDVHVGKDGWLFLIGGNNQVLAQYRRSWWPSRHYWRWRRLIERRFSTLQDRGIVFLQLVVPEKLTVYGHKVDGLDIDVATAPIEQLGRRLRHSRAKSAWVDVLDAMRARRDATDLYLRTDSHWNHEGGFIAYEVLCRCLGAAAKPALRDERFHAAIAFSGDLGLKCEPSPTETARFHALQRDSKRTYASAIVQDYEAQGRLADLHLGTHVVFENDAVSAQQKRIILFGDSYANFIWNSPGGNLTGFLAETFREVHFVWSPTIDWDYVEKVRPDVVICEIAERFLFRVPPFGCKISKLEERVRALKP